MKCSLAFNKDQIDYNVYLPILYKIDVDARSTTLFTLKALILIVELLSVWFSTCVIFEGEYIFCAQIHKTDVAINSNGL